MESIKLIKVNHIFDNKKIDNIAGVVSIVGFIKRQLNVWERMLSLFTVPLFVFPILSGSLLIWVRILVTVIIVFFYTRNNKNPDKEEVNNIGVVN